MKIAIGSDHAGFRYKENIKRFLQELGHEVKDFGTFSEESVDYPLYIRPVAVAVARGECERGIVLGGSGNGEAIVANRVQGVRCTLCWNVESALFARKHNDSNVLSLGQRLIADRDVLEIVRAWLNTPFEGGRHIRRIRMIDELVDEGGDGKAKSGSPLEGSVQAGSEEPLPFPPSAAQRHASEYDVFIAFRYIRYTEGEDSIMFEVEPGLKSPTVIKVPSTDKWNANIPVWARDRREEILGRVRSKCSHLNFELKEV